jgi:hypothetical protein
MKKEERNLLEGIEEIMGSEDILNKELDEIRGGRSISDESAMPGCRNGGGCSGGNGSAFEMLW